MNAPEVPTNGISRSGVIVAKVVGDGIADDTAAIQAAIDQAVSLGVKTTVIPDGKVCKTTAPIFLDPPGNLRTNLNNPPMFGFSLQLVGGGGENNNLYGTTIAPADNTFTTLWVGSGQGMEVHDINFRPQSGTNAHRKLFNTAGSAIAISGGGGGTSRTLLKGIGIWSYYQGITTGTNNGALADSNTLFKCFIDNCYIGVNFTATQNYINSLYDCVVSDCTFAVANSVFQPGFNIFGGNYSTPGAASGSFAITNVSPLTQYSIDYPGVGNGLTNWRFTGTIASPDQHMMDGIYDKATLLTTNFGIVPLTVENFTKGTITLSFDPIWRFTKWPLQIDLANGTDIASELQNSSTLKCYEQITTWYGVRVNVQGAHVENPQSLTRLLYTKSYPCSINNVLLDWNISNYDTPSSFDGQQVFPFLELNDAKVEYNNTISGSPDPNPVGVYLRQTSQFDVRRSTLKPNIHFVAGPYNPIWSGEIGGYGNSGSGWGDFDRSPFLPYVPGATDVTVPTRGYLPHPNWLPRITSSQLAAFTPAPPPLGTYNPLHGGNVYSVIDYNSGPLNRLFARSAHALYSYGQDLNVTWTYKGQSHALNVSGPDVGKLFPGLAITVNNGTDGDRQYYINGVYLAFGYVTVVDSDMNSLRLFGDKKTVYSGAVIKQQPYLITQY